MLRSLSFVVAAILFVPPGAFALTQYTGGTPVVISDGTHAFESVAVYQSAPVTLQAGGQIGGFLIGYQFSELHVLGGSIGTFLHAYTQADAFVRGGTIAGDLVVSQIATIEFSGGAVGGSFLAQDGGEIRIFGSGFRVDGNPVGLGPVTATTGVLSGNLASGAGFSNPFRQGEAGSGAAYTGRIVLVPEPARIGLLASAVCGATARLRRVRRRSVGQTALDSPGFAR